MTSVGAEPESVGKVMGGDERSGHTWKIEMQDATHGTVVEGYMTGNLAPDGTLREVFFHGFGKEGSTLDGWAQFSAILFSLGLQAGVDFGSVARRVGQMRFEPFGRMTDPEIPFAPSVPAYVVCRLALSFGDEETVSGVREVMAEWAP